MARPFEFNKGEVLQKAMLLFWSKGYFNTSAHDIVAHLGLSRSSIYNSFSDKRTLFIAALNHYIQTESEGLVEALSQLSPTPESIGLILGQVVDQHFDSQKPKGCLAVNTAIEFANYDPEIKSIIQSNIDQVVGAFEVFIQKGQQAGTITSAIPAKSLSIALFNQITALKVTGKVVFDRSFFMDNIQVFLKVFNI